MKIVKIIAAGAVAAAAIAGAATATPPGPLYETTYFTDASMTTAVGHRLDLCINGNVGAGPLHGTKTDYFTKYVVGACPGGYW